MWVVNGITSTSFLLMMVGFQALRYRAASQ
jgi:hypothetical protein